MKVVEYDAVLTNLGDFILFKQVVFLCMLKNSGNVGGNKAFALALSDNKGAFTSDSEYSILKILHEYFRIHPDEYFYSEEDWFYTMEDIEKIYEKDDWYHWCYKKPS